MNVRAPALAKAYPFDEQTSAFADDVIGKILPKDAALVEFGAGATTKVRLLLERCQFGAYVPVDISGDFLNAQADALSKDFPDLAVHAVAADFSAPFALPAEIADR